MTAPRFAPHPLDAATQVYFLALFVTSLALLTLSV
jgi:hypothetical protein